MDTPPETSGSDFSADGLSPTQKYLLRYAGFPLLRMALNWQRALWLFEKDASRILHRVGDIPTLKRQSPAAVPPLMGLGHSVRRWSVAATLEHLLEVGEATSELIVGTKCPPARTISRCVPASRSTDVRQRYEHFVDQFASHLRMQNGPCPEVHPHRWLGPVTAHGWLVLLVVHQLVHRRQVDEITKALGCC